MHQTNIKNIDLNLLPALDALLACESVSKAAQQVGLSQPAMSRALERLRHVVKDPLLVRSGRGMVLTPRGEALREPVRDAIAGVAAVMSPQVFDPAQATDHFRIMAPDYVAQMIMPIVLGRVFAQAPGIQIEMENLSEAAIDRLRTGETALGFGVVNDGPLLDMAMSQALFDDRLVCLMRKDHPLSKAPLTLEGYAQASHAMLSVTGKGGSRIDKVLQSHGLTRTVSLRITHFLTISAVIAPTDLLITVPKQLAQQVLTAELNMVELPEAVRLPPFTVSQIWHDRFTQDPAHRWLRGLVKEAWRNCQLNG